MIWKKTFPRPGARCTEAVFLPFGASLTVTRSPVINRTVLVRSFDAGVCASVPCGDRAATGVITPATTIADIEITAPRRIRLIGDSAFLSIPDDRQGTASVSGRQGGTEPGDTTWDMRDGRRPAPA
ncbi:hypothetical protein [Streptomyces wuyuanensis]|uniref:hypothetical protein n=1 Tax=Streptomyces wuyuanensis TaxID=1196353 RepID=UPI001FCD196F|nr:hypothetical protein [Streptomyces wuyuanensis]